jgi:hypothetical protein
MVDLSCIVFDSSDEAPCILKDPIKKEEQRCTADECCDYLIEYKKKDSEAQSFNVDACKLWWARKWYVPLDYYLLSSTDTRKPSAKPQSHASIHIKKDHSYPITLLNHAAKDQLLPIQAIFRRKTHREFSEQPVPSSILAALLKTTHAGTLLNDIWTYHLTVVNVKDLTPGIYHYDATNQELQLVVHKEICRGELVKVFCGSTAPLTASFCLTLAINVNKAQTDFPYSRALREAYIDAGRIAGRILLKGIQHNVGGVPLAARDILLCQLLAIDSHQSIPIHTILMGSISQ